MKGKGGLTLTGQLGDVMKESAIAALSWIRSRSSDLKISDTVFSRYDIHVHVPQGAIPKDGPSAGVSLATSLVSLLTQRLVRDDLAMTGEITLTGKVLPVGGIKEKVLAAKSAGLTHVILPERNRNDLEDFNEEVTEGMTFHFVQEIGEVLDIALKKQAPTTKNRKSSRGSNKSDSRKARTTEKNKQNGTIHRYVR